jgi:hypothetical protein
MNDATQFSSRNNVNIALHGFRFGTNHGFNVDDGGARTLGPLESQLRARGAEVVEFDRGHEGLLAAANEDDEAAEKLAAYFMQHPTAREKNVLVGHSHGCNIIHQAFELHPELANYVGHALLVNPALRRKALFPSEVNVVCYHSDDDKIVSSAKWLRVLPWRWFVPHPWGEAGRYGLEDTHATRRNIDLKCLHNAAKLGHSGGLLGQANAGRLAESFSRQVAIPRCR